jgi:2-polyprenyl-3-methyl-5-hydroxy-6-metoxy-1,4-benzoquinol methylase
MPNVAYQDQTFNTRNPIARYAHRARLQRSIGYADGLLSHGGHLVDFGCGTGDFLRAFKVARPDANLIGYEPFLSPGTEAFRRIADMNALPAASADLVTSFEVLEHLEDRDIEAFIAHARRVLKPGGRLLVSVPIIGGLTLLLKESNRMLLFRRRSEYSTGELLRATFLGQPAPRPVNRLVTHKGFDFRAARAMLEQSFTTRFGERCPFQHLPWWLNSQLFLAFTR